MVDFAFIMRLFLIFCPVAAAAIPKRSQLIRTAAGRRGRNGRNKKAECFAVTKRSAFLFVGTPCENRTHN